MKPFNYYQPTEIMFGSGRVAEIAGVVKRFGRRCLLVTTPPEGILEEMYQRVTGLLEAGGLTVAHFDGVVPNPTTDCIREGAALAKEFGADMVVGLGGGSSIDTAKAVAVECSHEGPAWDYRIFSGNHPTEKTLPIIAVSTTSGTGSEVAQVAVITEAARKDKSVMISRMIIPRVAIIDPELTLSLPPTITAQTGFDVFAHAFESYLHPAGSPLTDQMATQALQLVAKYLPTAVKQGDNLVAREAMALANVLGGISVGNAGPVLPHGISMAIGGQCPQMAHGQALAAVYPAFTRAMYAYAVDKFAPLGRLLDPSLEHETDEAAAEGSCQAVDRFLKELGLWHNLEELGVTREALPLIADHSLDLPDFSPRAVNRDEVFDMVLDSYQRA